MRRLTLSPLPSRRRAAAIWPAAVAGTIALTLVSAGLVMYGLFLVARAKLAKL